MYQGGRAGNRNRTDILGLFPHCASNARVLPLWKTSVFGWTSVWKADALTVVLYPHIVDFVLPVPPRSYTQLNSPARHCPSQVIHWQHKALLTDLRSITRGFIPKFRINLQKPPCSTTLTYDSVSNDSSVLLYDSRRLIGTTSYVAGSLLSPQKDVPNFLSNSLHGFR